MEFEDIYKEYFKEVYYYLCSMCGDTDLCEDIAQETFFKALKNIERFDGNKDIRAWLFTIAKNSYISYLRKRGGSIHLDEDISYEADIGDKLSDSETALKLHAILHKLREPYKEVFSLRVFGELSFENIGKLFGKSAGWARVTYYRAKMMIIKETEDNDD